MLLLEPLACPSKRTSAGGDEGLRFVQLAGRDRIGSDLIRAEPSGLDPMGSAGMESRS